MLQRARHVVDRARERIRAAAEHDPHAWPDGTVLVLQDGSRAVVDHVEEPLPGNGHHATSAPRDATPLALGSPHPDAPDVDVAGGVSGPPTPGGAPPAPGRDRARGSLLAPREAPRAVERDVPRGLRVAAAWSWRTVAVVAALYLLLRAAGYVAVVIVPVIVALLLAALLQPGAAFLRHRGWPTSLAALTMLVVGVGVVAGIVTLVVEEFVAGYADLVSQVDEGLTQVQDFVTRTFPVTDGQITDALESASQSIADNQDVLTSGALTTAATVGGVLTGALLTLFTLFFFLLDGRQIWLWVVGLTPLDSQAHLDEAARRSWRTLISYVRATVGVAAFDAVFIGIGLVFLGTPLVVPLAALVFLGAFVPIIGSFLAGTVSVLVTLVAVGPVRALIALGIIVLIMQLESHVLQPLLLGRAVSVHPLAVVLGIAAGLLIGGVFGALIAVPVIACGNVAGTYLSRRHEGPRPPQPDTRRARRPVTAR
ncbi:AI-2E family transporter [Modestobacter sp. VKM Ac-2985]|uniref:AI-2E family transporter n=1 Tax=Modestobacter sp. VKM Ac-2985 TaxID=3004139 RepID=UPI0022ABC4A7|nr:AI-2E family transporter [Modestobacter sp. VKM Ac-2985]MCZ2838222.1 AI-2E family transporter [Modestobacter sp. VKM Ac-2985]